MTFIPGSSKKVMIETLRHYNVNHVIQIPAWDFAASIYSRSELKAKLLALRSIRKEGGGGIFIRELDWKAVMFAIGKSNIHIDDLIVCEDLSYQDANNLICNGEVLIYKDKFNVWAYTGWINKHKGLSIRDASSLVTCNCNGNFGITLIKNRHQIPVPLFKELWSKGITNAVVEFSLYTVPVGIKQEKLLIWEIRRNY